MPVLYTFSLETHEKTKEYAQKLASISAQGDVFCLVGAIGAGKTTFARYFIQEKYPHIHYVPSPSYTLVEIYEDTLYHADLMRLNHADDIQHLGLEEAMRTGICLIEWANVLEGKAYPKNALTLKLSMENTHRILMVEGDDPWKKRLLSLWG